MGEGVAVELAGLLGQEARLSTPPDLARFQVRVRGLDQPTGRPPLSPRTDPSWDILAEAATVVVHDKRLLEVRDGSRSAALLVRGGTVSVQRTTAWSGLSAAWDPPRVGRASGSSEGLHRFLVLVDDGESPGPWDREESRVTAGSSDSSGGRTPSNIARSSRS